MKTLLLTLLLTFPLLAGNLQLKKGFVQSHTEMMIDSKIDSLNKALHVEANIINNDIITINGKFWVDVSLFISDNEDRDEHMDEATEAKKFPLATYTLSSITKADTDKDAYTLHGELEFHGVKKPVIFNAQILNKETTIEISAETQILGPDFGIEMPCMVFMCVDDEIDILVELTLSK
jgi:polyisoprenoid-binding protein YceI